MNNPSPNTFTAAAALARTVPLKSGSEPREWIQYLPAGRHEITCTVREGGVEKARTIQAVSDPAAAAALQRDLTAMLALGHGPFIDFEHEAKAAAAWLQEFRWDDAEGVQARVDLTSAGEEAVRGGVVKYFSPEWRIDLKTGRCLGLLPNRPAGGLTNLPAFRDIAAVCARAAALPHTLSAPAETNQTTTMNHEEIAAAAVEAGLLTPDEAAGENPGAALKAKVATLKSTAAAAAAKSAAAAADTTELTAVKARLSELEEEVKSTAEAAGKEAVAAAERKGSIPAKDTEGKAWWLAQASQPGPAGTAARARLAALPSLLPQDTGSGARAADRTPADATHESAAVQARAAAVEAKAAELKATHPNADFNTRWHMAEGLIPPAQH
jgi:hypothetical protein